MWWTPPNCVLTWMAHNWILTRQLLWQTPDNMTNVNYYKKRQLLWQTPIIMTLIIIMTPNLWFRPIMDIMIVLCCIILKFNCKNWTKTLANFIKFNASFLIVPLWRLKRKYSLLWKTKFQKKVVVRSKNTSTIVIKIYDLSLWRGD